MTQKEVSRIVVGFDYSPTAELALNRAFELAALDTRSEVHVVTVVMMSADFSGAIDGAPPYPLISVEAAHEALEKRTGVLLSNWRENTGRDPGRVVTHVRLDAPSNEIVQVAVDLEAQLIVVGTHGRRGVRRLLLGSVAEGVVRMAHCEVLVVRPKDPAAEVPQIQPPCAHCVEARKASNGLEYWCEQHRERHGQRHTYHYANRAAQDGNISGLMGTR